MLRLWYIWIRGRLVESALPVVGLCQVFRICCHQVVGVEVIFIIKNIVVVILLVFVVSSCLLCIGWNRSLCDITNLDIPFVWNIGMWCYMAICNARRMLLAGHF